MLEEVMLGKKIWAVVGANQNPAKYGNIIYRKLKKIGYEVYPVNPIYDDIDGDKCYKNLTSLPVNPDVIDMVVTPKRSKKIVVEAKKLGINYIWLQPGTYDDELMEMIDELELTAVQACVLVATTILPVQIT
ncbi:MAG: CoA-binding protein [Clostridiales bacterium]|nr:CoA-binding protein [Clostridiales bacterium]